jgi:hypothetical protein
MKNAAPDTSVRRFPAVGGAREENQFCARVPNGADSMLK